MEREYQRAINRMGRATVGALQSTPLGIVMVGGKLGPAKLLLDYHQAKFVQRLMIRPNEHHAGKEGGRTH